MKYVANPYRFDHRGRTAEATLDQHIRDLIEAVLFTSSGERVNRPAFGAGVAALVFEPTSPEAATATQFLVQGSLQQFLGSLIEVRNVDVQIEDSTLRVRVDYVSLVDGRPGTLELERGGG